MAPMKVEPTASYPVEEGQYVLGDKYSPVAVAVHTLAAKWDERVEAIVRTAIDSGAAIAGSIQTPNLGIERIVANTVGNPNIRYLVMCGAGSKEGMAGAKALKALATNGADKRGVIVDSGVEGAYVFNISREAIDRFREQVRVIDLCGEYDAGAVRQVVEACRNEQPGTFRGMPLQDPGAFDGPPINAKIEIKVKDPFSVEEWELDDILNEI